ncbi:beta-ketoacyl synthase chain length factor [Paraburkholderia tagetis]|uniref:Beta-ketoacyl synthase chain length factor n=1 Tax=Paraburkholderia tagetis TaxID=2913261 RepID=A0A9X1UCS5_9BURK|nr:beta-ketoacyl synthase chain length factor [Paraburkholderia tagetis]MCG5071889.1 beta-ketoacyl synthase chain length factor [Paraburkholderia tagetis]
MKLRASIESIGLIGPGLADWPHAADVLAGRAPWTSAPTELPPPAGLPGAERRRAAPVVKTALAVAHEAVAASSRDATTLATVFAASGGDGLNCHAICEMLAGDDRQISPTRFHNSVHNAAAGYWSIAAQARATSNVLCAHDASFAAGLLESLCQIAVDGVPSLLIAYETAYPEPLHAVRPIADAFGVALLLAPAADDAAPAKNDTSTSGAHAPAKALACIEVKLTDAPATTLAAPELEALRAGNPAARGLPLLEAIATGRAASVVIDYLPETRVRIDVTPPGSHGERSP